MSHWDPDSSQTQQIKDLQLDLSEANDQAEQLKLVVALYMKCETAESCDGCPAKRGIDCGLADMARDALIRKERPE